MEQTINDVGYDITCKMPRCGSEMWSTHIIERCPNCGSTSLEVTKEPTESNEKASNLDDLGCTKGVL